MNGSGPEITFVVPCFNYGRYLPDCLDSIFAQQGNYSFEIIAIDDTSTDNTPDVLSRYRDSRLTVLRHENNQGHVTTMTEGLRAARGRYVARIDPDDRYRPWFLAETVPCFNQFPDIGLVYGNAALIDSDGRITAETTDPLHDGQSFKGSEFIALLEKNFICAPTAIARREAWLEALPLPADIAFNDWYFNLMIARRRPFRYINRVLADYRVHSANHHRRIVRDRSEEPSIRALLDRIFGDDETDAALQREKRRVRGKVYGAQYLTLADKYFGFWMREDARRCYLKAVGFHPRYLLSFTILRRLAATWLSEQNYIRLKQYLKRSAA